MSNILKQRLEAKQSPEMEHPSANLLTAFVERTLRSGERDGVLSHLSACPACREAVVLAVPEIANRNMQGVQSWHARVFRFPVPVRWASAAAALAVAIGIGIIANEHQAERKTVQVQARQAAQPQVPPPQSAENSGAKQAPSTPISSDKSVRDRLVTHEIATTHKAKQMATPATENRFAANLRRRQSMPAVVDQKQPEIVSGLLAGSPARALTIRNEVLDAKSTPARQAPQTAAPSAYAPMAQSVAVEATSEPGVAPSASVTLPRRGAESNQGQVAMLKSSNLAATGGVPGGLLRRSLAQSNQIVSWTISNAGKLLRRAQNGVLNVVEPAAGLTVRAVAARGIEVWAGGVQPDVSAKTWQQRPALFHSSDAGETWNKVDGPWAGSIHRLDLASENSLTVIADDGTWSTTDAGKSWVKR